MLDVDDLNDADVAILDELQRHPMTRAAIASRTGFDPGYVSQRLKRLREHSHVAYWDVEQTMHELTNDPREEGS
jgi:DNA-binding IclR family transcriptional regulator